jgi:hypothetical protein
MGLLLQRMCWIIGRKSKLSVTNKLLIYKIILKTHLDLWVTIMWNGIPVKHRDTTKTAEQNSQTGDQRTTVRAQPGTPH